MYTNDNDGNYKCCCLTCAAFAFLTWGAIAMMKGSNSAITAISVCAPCSAGSRDYVTVHMHYVLDEYSIATCAEFNRTMMQWLVQ